MERDWQHGPEETCPEREERINILLKELHMSIQDGQETSLEEIADFVGCDAAVIYRIEARALNKLRLACGLDEDPLLLEVNRPLSARVAGMAAIMELWQPQQNL